MQTLDIERDLSKDEYLLGKMLMGGILVTVYRTTTEVIITDAEDRTKIYQITAVEFSDRVFGCD